MKIFFTALMFCAVFGAYNMCKSSQKVDFLSKFVLSEVEALADDETYCLNMPGSNTGKCKPRVGVSGAACVASVWYEFNDCFK